MIRAGVTSLIAGMCEELDVVGTLNRLVEWDENQVKVPPGILAKAVLINILDDRHALYLLPEYYKKRDTESLLGAGVQPEDINDDAVGRMLDRLAQAGPRQVFTQIAWSAVGKEHLDLGRLHADTTSHSVYGVYPQEGGLDVTHGYSKDRRPDLRQIMYGLVVNRDGVPALGEVLDGNTSDKRWNQQTLEKLGELLSPEQLRSIIYIADSALVTPDSLERAADQGLRFISRFPQTYALAEELKDLAWEQGAWVQVGTLSEQKGAAAYRVQDFRRELEGRPYRFIVVHSTHLDGRKEKRLARLIRQEQEELTKAAGELGHQEFACQQDAEQAAQAFASRYPDAFHTMQAAVDPQTEVQRRPGRPRKGEVPPTRTGYRVTITVGDPDPQRLQRWREQASVFILITNLLDATAYPAEQILREYKEQTSVEVRFRFLKDPFFVHQLYLKDKGRLEAFAYLVLTALLLFTLIERRVRQALAAEEEPLVGRGQIKHKRPTGRVVLELIADADVVLIPHDGVIIRHLDIPPNALRALHLAGFGPELYTRPYPGGEAA